MLVLQHIDIAHWAGLGGVRYIPSEYVDTETGNLKELDESEIKMINQRNMELVRRAVKPNSPLRVQFLLTFLGEGGKSKKLWLY